MESELEQLVKNTELSQISTFSLFVEEPKAERHRNTD